MTPEIHIPFVNSYEALLNQARSVSRDKLPTAALVVPSEIDTLRAFVRATEEGLIDPLIIGDESLLRKNLEAHSVDLGDTNIVDFNQPDMAVQAAARMAKAGEIDMIVQGKLLAADLLSGLFAPEQEFRMPGKMVSHVAVLKTRKYPKLLLLSDSTVVVQPDLKAKLSLIENIVFVSEKIGISNPRIAVIGAVEVIYPQMPATMEAAILAKMAERGQIKGAKVDGPLSFDVAVDLFAARSKGITDSPVAGQADAMVAPCIEVANGIYHAMSLYGGCEIGGVVVGGRVPIAVNSHADSVDARFNSIVLSVLCS
ncbi:MAG: phosphate butyryltransferase [bacterium]|nr:phosphate butyryltransferase [bacterium]